MISPASWTGEGRRLGKKITGGLERRGAAAWSVGGRFEV